MPGKKIKTEEEEKIIYCPDLVISYITNDRIKDIATATGYSERTISRLANDQEFQKAVAEYRYFMTKSVMNVIDSNLKRCAESIVEVMQDKDIDPKTRLQACNMLMEFSEKIIPRYGDALHSYRDFDAIKAKAKMDEQFALRFYK